VWKTENFDKKSVKSQRKLFVTNFVWSYTSLSRLSAGDIACFKALLDHCAHFYGISVSLLSQLK